MNSVLPVHEEILNLSECADQCIGLAWAPEQSVISLEVAAKNIVPVEK